MTLYEMLAHLEEGKVGAEEYQKHFCEDAEAQEYYRGNADAYECAIVMLKGIIGKRD